MYFLQGRNISIDWLIDNSLRSLFPELNRRNNAQSSIRDWLSWRWFFLLFLLKALIEISASLQNCRFFLILFLFEPGDICSWFGCSIYHRTFSLHTQLLFEAIYWIIVFFDSSISQLFQFFDLFFNVFFASKGSQFRTRLGLIERFSLWRDQLLTCIQIFRSQASWESQWV